MAKRSEDRPAWPTLFVSITVSDVQATEEVVRDMSTAAKRLGLEKIEIAASADRGEVVLTFESDAISETEARKAANVILDAVEVDDFGWQVQLSTTTSLNLYGSSSNAET